ncbi:MAG TPA: phasin family protein [Rhizomicrobium sp.]|jgi:hypothetical protein
MARTKRRTTNHAHDAIDEIDETMDEMQDGVEEAGDEALRVTHRAAGAALEAFDLFGAPMVRLLDHNRTLFQKMMQAMQEESLRFVNRRLERTGRALESTRDCRSVTGLMAVQNTWLLDFARDYSEQTTRVAEIMRGTTEESANAASEASA